jgi:DNA-binding transcriptional regulator LsrR (DeoR family)
MNLSLEHQRLLYKIARDYYLNQYTQHQIAKRLGLSRIKVSRLLKQARKEQVVNITLTIPTGLMADLEYSLENKYQLEEVKVVYCETQSDMYAVSRELAPAAAECLIRRITGNEIVGVTWGRTMMSVIDALPSRSFPKVRIVQMNGGLGTLVTHEHSTELSRRIAGKLSAQLHLLPAPGIASNKESVAIFKKDKIISETLNLAAMADIALVGIGVLSSNSFILQDGSILSENDIIQLKRAGSVGDIVLRYFDKEGRLANSDINERVIGLSFEELQHIPCVIAVGGGDEKYPAIRAALKTDIPSVLVTDQKTAQKLCDE